MKLPRRGVSGFTIAEALITIVIITLLGALLYPSFVAAVRHSKTNTSVQRMRQLFVAIETYRNDYGGSNIFNSYRSYYAVGLPLPSFPGYVEFEGIADEFWKSPCAGTTGDQIICSTATMPGECGNISYVAGLYRPDVIDTEPIGTNANRVEYKDYLVVYQQNSVLLVDVHCNPPGTLINAPLTRKRGIAMLLSGQIVNKLANGDASSMRLRWYSQPPDY